MYTEDIILSQLYTRFLVYIVDIDIYHALEGKRMCSALRAEHLFFPFLLWR